MASFALFLVLALFASAIGAVVIKAILRALVRPASEPAMTTLPAPNMVVTLVHGTWGRRSSWRSATSPLGAALSRSFPNALITPFNWGGANTITSRARAGHALSEHLHRLITRHPRAAHWMIAHSHGGTIAMYALNEEFLRTRVGLICLSTPFIHVRPRAIPRVAKFALAGAAMMLPLVMRELVEDYLWVSMPSPVVGLSVLVALAIGVGIIKTFPRMALRISGDLTIVGAKPAHCLLIRAAGDEASAALGSLQLINWLTTTLWVKPTELIQAAYDTFLEWSASLERWSDRLFWWWVSGSATAVFVGMMLRGIAPRTANLLTITGFGVALTGWCMSIVPSARTYLLLLGFFLLGMLFTPLPVFLGLLLIPFGPELAPYAVLLDVSAEPTPPGTWQVCQLPTQPPDKPIPMMHSASYSLPEAIHLIITWMQERNHQLIVGPSMT